MPKIDSTDPPCALCPSPRIHRVHEEISLFESLRSLRRDQRVQYWAVSVLRAARRGSPRVRMDADQADKLAWKLHNHVVHEELADD